MSSLRARSARGAALCHGMAVFLRWMTLAAGLLILTGGILFLARQGHTLTHYQHFAGEPASLRAVSLVAPEAMHGQPLALIQAGVLLLVLTPVVRVAFAVVSYALEWDWLYVGIAGVVLAILCFGLVG